MPVINKTTAHDKYIRYEKAIDYKREKTFSVTLSNDRYEYLNTCCHNIKNKYGFMPTRQQQSEMIEKLFMNNKK